MKQKLARALVPRTVRNWLRSPSKSIRYIADRTAFAFGACPTVTPAEGWTVRCHPAARQHFEVFRKEREQSDELSAFADHCHPGMRLLDIGAHYGLFSLACIHYAGKDARVICVEASPKAAGILSTNLALNHSGEQILIENCAMGDRDGELQMLATGPIGGDYFLVPTEDRTDTIRVPQQTIVSLVSRTGFTPTHIKIDIEGFEFEVISAAKDFLSEVRPTLFLELHGTMLKKRGKDPAHVVSNLRSAGYLSIICDDKLLSDEAIAEMGFDCRLIAIAR